MDGTTEGNLSYLNCRLGAIVAKIQKSTNIKHIIITCIIYLSSV